MLVTRRKSVNNISQSSQGHINRIGFVLALLIRASFGALFGTSQIHKRKFANISNCCIHILRVNNDRENEMRSTRFIIHRRFSNFSVRKTIFEDLLALTHTDNLNFCHILDDHSSSVLLDFEIFGFGTRRQK